MASESEARRVASDKLGQAITEHIDPSGMLGDWVVVACSVEVDAEGDPVCQYHMAFSGGSMLDHIAIGLVNKGRELLSGGEMREDGAAES